MLSCIWPMMRRPQVRMPCCSRLSATSHSVMGCFIRSERGGLPQQLQAWQASANEPDGERVAKHLQVIKARNASDGYVGTQSMAEIHTLISNVETGAGCPII